MKTTPRRLTLLCLLVAIAAPAAGAQNSPAADTELNNAAINKGIAFLLSKQNPDGSFHEWPKNETVLTSLSILALASMGHMPSDSTVEGVAVRRALSFVLRNDRQTPAGYFGAADTSRMYGHGITTLMLTEMLGMGTDAQQDEVIHARCQRGIDMIVRSQHAKKGNPVFEGGWRYQPTDSDADLSVSVWQILALRSAKNAGLDVPDETIDAALAYVRRSFIVDRDPRPGFSYQPINYPPTMSMDCAGLLLMQLCGQANSDEGIEAVPWLYGLENPAAEWFYYTCYYQAQALHQHGSENDARMLRLVMENLRKQQSPDGFFIGSKGPESQAGRVYTTSMAILALSVNHHYLPIYQK